MSKPLTALLLGAGLRGRVYGSYALENPAEVKFVAVAEPIEERRRHFAQAHGIAPELQFASWEQALSRKQLADFCLNATQDQDHHASTLAALAAGYDLLLEKPMAPGLEESLSIVQAAESSGRVLEICHVLRHTPFFSAAHEVLSSGRIGDLVTFEQRESIGYQHMAHSFVRGNWRRANAPSPLLLQKCCHDLDILRWNLGRLPSRVQSFGSLLHFRKERAPAGATARCTDGCPVADECLYDARRAYSDLDAQRRRTTVTLDPSQEGLIQALQSGPFGRCVYQCDNDVVDHQTVSFEFRGGVTGILVVEGHSEQEERFIRYVGTRGTLVGRTPAFGEQILEFTEHLTRRTTRLDLAPAKGGHGGGDHGLMRDFVALLRGPTRPLHLAREALDSHLMVHAAELSRAKGEVVAMDAFVRTATEQTARLSRTPPA